MIRIRPPRADVALALFLAVLAATAFIAWPVREIEPNGAWYAIAIARLVGLMVIATVHGLEPAGRRPLQRRGALGSLAFAWALTLPFEVVAWFASVPAASLAWSLIASLPAAVSVYGATSAIASVARGARLGWALPLLVPLAAVGIGAFDVRTEPVLILPWLLPFAPSWTAAVVLGTAAVVTVLVGLRTSRPRAAAP